MEGQEQAKAARDSCSDLPGLSLVHPQLSPGESLAPALPSTETHTISNRGAGCQPRTKPQRIPGTGWFYVAPYHENSQLWALELFTMQ